MRVIILSNMSCKYVADDDNFFTSLDKNGLDTADNLTNIASEYLPDHIFCSPFLSSLQTIFPISNKYSIKVNIDNALYPINMVNIEKSSDICPKNLSLFKTHNYTELSNHYEYLTDIINHYYTSSILSNNISVIETEGEVKNRVFPFLFNIINKYKDTDKTIMFVSHANLCSYISKYLKIVYNEKNISNKKFEDGKTFIFDIPYSKNNLYLE